MWVGGNVNSFGDQRSCTSLSKSIFKMIRNRCIHWATHRCLRILNKFQPFCVWIFPEYPSLSNASALSTHAINTFTTFANAGVKWTISPLISKALSEFMCGANFTVESLRNPNGNRNDKLDGRLRSSSASWINFDYDATSINHSVILIRPGQLIHCNHTRTWHKT